jgi:hypothetical protein
VRYPNVYADTSGVRRFHYIVQAVARAGAKKVIFGSDGPWLHPGLELHKIRLLGLPPEQEALILGGNVLRLLRQARVGRQFVDRSPAIRLQPPPGRISGPRSPYPPTTAAAGRGRARVVGYPAAKARGSSPKSPNLAATCNGGF